MAKVVANPNKWNRFQTFTSNKHFRTIGMISGEHGTGKTRLGATMPGPVIFQSLDSGLEGVVDQVVKPDKAIRFNEYAWNPEAEDFNQDYAIAVRDKILEDFRYVLANGPASIVWDKETDIREVFEYAEFGSPTGGAPRDWGKVNTRYFNLINSVKAVPNINFLLIQSMKNKWGTKEVYDRNTGGTKSQLTMLDERVRAGFNRLAEVVFVELHAERRPREGGGSEFVFLIGKNRQNSKMQDIEIPACSFPELGTMLIDGSDPTDWDATYTPEEE